MANCRAKKSIQKAAHAVATIIIKKNCRSIEVRVSIICFCFVSGTQSNVSRVFARVEQWNVIPIK